MEPKAIAQLKSNCFIQQADKEYFSVRLKVVGGHVTTEHMKKVCELAELYGKGYIHLTSRQSMEVPFVHVSHIENVQKLMDDSHLTLNKCGPSLRTITACQGMIVCKSGAIDTTKLAFELDKKFGGRPLPHKFKIGITGCANNCLKAEENDLGIKGGVEPKWNKINCTFCGACEKVCPKKVIVIHKDKKTVKLDRSGCITCGKCVKACKQDAWKVKKGFIVYFGGLFGNRIAIGRQVFPLIHTKKELFGMIEFTLNFFEKHGQTKERFANTLERVGWDFFLEEVKKHSAQ